MGKGDRKTRRGKIAIRAYGNKRPHTAATKSGTPAVKKAPATKTAPAKRAAAPAAKPAAPRRKPG